MKKTKTELKEIAREIMAEAIGCAYYRICDSNEITHEYSEEEEAAILEYIDRFGKAACKAIGKTYISY